MAGAGLLSWGNHPRIPQTPRSCHWRDTLPAELADTSRAHGTTLPFGNGRSYGDSCLAASDHVLHLKPLDRFVERRLADGRARGGSRHHARGHPQSRHSARLVRAGDSRARNTSRSEAPSPTTCTARITTAAAPSAATCAPRPAALGLRPPHAVARQRSRRCSRRRSAGSASPASSNGRSCSSCRSARASSRCSRIASTTSTNSSRSSSELDAHHEFSVSWIDCTARGNATGRGIFMARRLRRRRRARRSRRRASIDACRSRRRCRSSTALSLRAFNALYWRKAARGRRAEPHGLRAVLLSARWRPAVEPALWAAGFQQYQCVIPEARRRRAIRELLEAIAAQRARVRSWRCSSAAATWPRPALLSFPQAGVTLALDFPQNERLAERSVPAARRHRARRRAAASTPPRTPT